MAKNIVFFADGTWNGPGQDDNNDGVPDPTNVFRLFNSLQGKDSLTTKLLQDEQERIAGPDDGKLLQFAKYLHGVGDSRNVINKILGGSFGAGVINRVVRGYTFISRSYAAGDRIYICGFSRGAYTARALAGMICSQGLLNPGVYNGLEDREQGYRLGMAVWTRYRKAVGKSGSFLDYVLYRSGVEVSDKGLLPDVKIQAVGVWDTVGALGIPDYAAGEGRQDVFQFVDTKLSTKVSYGFHAVSIDERRADFTPTLWTPGPNVTEVWFAGAHADVGGGYATGGLSDIALLWMAQKLEEAGILLDASYKTAFKPDPYADGHMPWGEDPWRFLPFYDRVIPAGAQLHESVTSRRAKLAAYAPKSLAAFLGNAGRTQA